MSGKAYRTCANCGRHIAIHRGKRLLCSEDCRRAVKSRESRERKDSRRNKSGPLPRSRPANRKLIRNQ